MITVVVAATVVSMTRVRILAVAMAAATFLGLSAPAASAEPVPAFDFSDCPALPAGADPAQWRCEVLVSHGTVRLGRLGELPVSGLRTTFAEGQLGGKFAQVFGALRAEPIRVPGVLFGTRLRMEYAGFADFLSVGDRLGEQHFKIAVSSPLLPRICTIGSDADPIVFRPVRLSGGGPEPIIMRDNEFAVPGSHRCGPLGTLLEHRLGVPAAAGRNELAVTTTVGIRSYG